MKNSQQTPKMRRIAMGNAKAQLANSKPKAFQPRAAWESKRTVAGVAVDVLDTKQFNAPGRVYSSYYRNPWNF